MIYLCSPYSHSDPEVVKERYEKTVKYVNSLLIDGRSVISPVVYGHNIVEICGSPSDWGYWEEFCTDMIARCDEVLILPLDGWQDSVGIKGEMELAEQFKKQVTVINSEDIP